VPPGYGAPGPSGPSNGLGTAGLVLGIIGLILALVPFMIWLAVPLGIIGAILAFIGRSKARKGEATNGGAAMAGIITSLAAIVISIAWSVAFAVFIASNSDEFSNYSECVQENPNNVKRCADQFLR
jgi:uncharacterized membrane protein